MCEIRCALDDFDIPAVKTDSVSAVVNQVKTILARKGFEIQPLTEERLDHLDASVLAHVVRCKSDNGQVEKSLMEAKSKIESRLQLLEQMKTYDEYSKLTN